MKYEWRAVFLFVCLFFLEVYYSIYSSVYYWLFLIFFFMERGTWRGKQCDWF